MVEQSGGPFRFLFGSAAYSRSLDLSGIHSPIPLRLPHKHNQEEEGAALRIRNNLRSRGNSNRMVTVSRDTSSVK